MALGLNIVVGFAGLLDLGYVAFYAFGAYTMGWFASDHFAAINGEKGIHVLAGEFVSNAARHPPELPADPRRRGGPGCALVGMVIGLPTLRLRGDYIAIVTLAFGEIIYRFAVNGDEISFAEGYELTNGRQAISPVDQIDLPLFARVRLGVRPAPVLLVRAGRWWRSSLFVQLPPARLAPRAARGSRSARTRWRRRRWACRSSRPSCWPTPRARAFGGMAGAFLGSYLNSVNAEQLPVRLLDLHPGHGHPRRPGLDLGRRARRGRAVASSTRT